LYHIQPVTYPLLEQAHDQFEFLQQFLPQE
jgi:hypothetical protein